ncbi:MAG: PH domain-containing protein [Hyphomicrobiaceae bacterium]|nr:PH domain-containing protein [Hyphomicrobiaceae bacterium]
MTALLEFEQEPIKGIPGLLPASEDIVWQGAPTWRSVLVHVLHVRWVVAYFGAIMAWRAYSHIVSGNGIELALSSASWLGFLGLLVVGILAGVALMITRTTVYTITSKRVILRYGLVVPVAVNVPFAKIEAADVQRFADGTGEIPLRIGGGEQFAYWMMWPHVRRWHFMTPQPMFRSVAEPVKVAAILAKAIETALPAGEAFGRGAVGARMPVMSTVPEGQNGLPQPA